MLIGCQPSRTMPSRVLVLGIDGGSWDVIDELFAKGELPNLKRLYDSGIHGTLESRPPVLSPVVWSTIFTGRPWQEHGVKDWQTSQSSHRKVKALWDITTQLGIKTTLINVPSSWPPTPVSGSMVAGFPLSGSTIGGNTGEVVTVDGFDRPNLPAHYKFNEARIRERMSGLETGKWSDWFQVEVRGRPKLRVVMRVFRFEDDKYYLTPFYRTDDELVITYPKELHAEIDRTLGQPYVPEGPGWSRYAEEDTPKFLYDHLLQVARVQADAAELLVKRPWDLFIYVDTLVDRVSHPYWAYMRPDDYEGLDPAKAERFREYVRNSYRETDVQLGKVLAAAKGDYWVVIVSDHGFQSNRESKQFIGTHKFDGIYLISAPGVRSTNGSHAYIEDVAPTVLYLLGKEVASDMTGKVIPEVINAGGRPVQKVASYESGAARGTDVPVDDRTWEQLKGLGYVDGAAPRHKPGAAQPEAKPQSKPPAKQQ